MSHQSANLDTAPTLTREFVVNACRRAIAECLAELRRNSPDGRSAAEVYHSPEAEAAKQEILRVGRKLWQRQYVDGNGGNISYRLTERFVLATPTLVSKGDLLAEEIAMVDMENRQLCGSLPCTSEIKLHLEIYQAESRARAVLHCHPSYATAHAIAGAAPQGDLLPEQEIFVGPVVVTPYETPGSEGVSRSVLPYIHEHNTILLGNHGVVCWADTVTHAEWFAEVVETYCKTLSLARQINPSLTSLPPHKVDELLATKSRLGLPDPRLPKIARAALEPLASMAPADLSAADEQRLVEALAEKVIAALAR